MGVCTVCGNDSGGSVCRFCGAKREPEEHKAFRHKTLNLELGRPFVDPAIARLLAEIRSAKMERVTVLTVIHGYGSSGKGGAIRDECRKILEHLRGTGEIKAYVPGEDFSGRTGPGKALLQRFPDLVHTSSLRRRNPGVTLVILS